MPALSLLSRTITAAQRNIQCAAAARANTVQCVAHERLAVALRPIQGKEVVPDQLVGMERFSRDVARQHAPVAIEQKDGPGCRCALRIS
jgi:hypothetical protein